MLERIPPWLNLPLKNINTSWLIPPFNYPPAKIKKKSTFIDSETQTSCPIYILPTKLCENEMEKN